jgi:hypothetical protein
MFLGVDFFKRAKILINLDFLLRKPLRKYGIRLEPLRNIDINAVKNRIFVKGAFVIKAT